MNVKPCIAIALAASILAVATGATAQQRKSLGFFEAYRPDIATKLKNKDRLLASIGVFNVTKGVAAGLKLWQPGIEHIRVCFFLGAEGSLDSDAQATLKRIIKIAARWGANNAHVPLDFGTAPNYRNCQKSVDGKLNHIRIGFADPAYWSLVGMDAIDARLVLQNDWTMNLPDFLLQPPPEKEFRRAVLHEFGHALGFEHEHRHPFSTCEDEFNWDVIRDEIAAPNNWDEESLKSNMRRLHDSADLIRTEDFDATSIMLYTLDRRFYLNPDQGQCAVEPSGVLSDLDKSLIAQMYPKDIAKRRKLFIERQRNFGQLTAGARRSSGLAKKASAMLDLYFTAPNE